MKTTSPTAGRSRGVGGTARAGVPSILTLNAGSSSIKFALFNADDSLRRWLSGSIERIGLPDAIFSVDAADPGERFSRPLSASDYPGALRALMAWLSERLGHETLAAAGHRVVHGGPDYIDAQTVTPQMIAALRRLSAYDPQHLPAEILLMEALNRDFSAVPQIACFDTAFHRDLPRVAQSLAIPRRYADKGVRRYGFHGLSYAFLMEALARLAGQHAASGRVVLAHLGNGASLAAVHEGRSIDTSMAFTPAAGVPMGTRSGDIDPGLVGYLAATEAMDAREFSDMINYQSGLLGISETTSDMHDLMVREHTDARAAEAIALFCYQVKKWIGAYAAALGGLDTLVFAGGIGEHAPEIRARICDGLRFLGIELDQGRNALDASVISADTSRVTVRMMRTDEEWMIAKTVCRVLGVPTRKDYAHDDENH